MKANVIFENMRRKIVIIYIYIVNIISRKLWLKISQLKQGEDWGTQFNQCNLIVLFMCFH